MTPFLAGVPKPVEDVHIEREDRGRWDIYTPFVVLMRVYRRAAGCAGGSVFWDQS